MGGMRTATCTTFVLLLLYRSGMSSVSETKHVSPAFLHDDIIVRVVCQTPDYILVGPFDPLDGMTEDDELIST